MPNKYQREIEELLNDQPDLNLYNKQLIITQWPKMINNQLSKIKSLIGSLLGHPRNRLITVFLSIVPLIALTVVLPGILSSTLWIILTILLLKFGLDLSYQTSKYERRWRGKIIETEPEENLINKFIKKFRQSNKP